MVIVLVSSFFVFLFVQNDDIYQNIDNKYEKNNFIQVGVCTQEARECPDGSYVSRTGPNCEFTPCPKTGENSNIQMANPASVFCEKNGGKLDIRNEKDGGQIGYCKFSDEKECEEWAYFRGECKK